LPITSSLFGLFAGRKSVARNGKKLTKYSRDVSLSNVFAKVGFAYHDGHADTRLFVAWY
jgi:hypothetical protein